MRRRDRALLSTWASPRLAGAHPLQTMAVNKGSRRVMEKVGLAHGRTFHQEFLITRLPGTEHGEVEYALTKGDWERGSKPGRRVRAPDQDC